MNGIRDNEVPENFKKLEMAVRKGQLEYLIKFLKVSLLVKKEKRLCLKSGIPLEYF